MYRRWERNAKQDDLRRIYGIGRREVAVLKALDIVSFADLGQADPDVLQDGLQAAGITLNGEDVQAWIGDALALSQDNQ